MLVGVTFLRSEVMDFLFPYYTEQVVAIYKKPGLAAKVRKPEAVNKSFCQNNPTTLENCL